MAKKIKIESGVGAIYARYSSHAQREESIEQQVEACMEKAKELGIEIIKTYSDKAISGKTDNRPQFQKMLRDAEKGKFQYLIAWKSNRLGRNMLNAMVNEERLNESGVRCLYVEEDFDDTAAGRFALRSMMNVNQFYIENMAEDIQRGLRDSAKECKVVGTIPFGYRKGEDKRFAINEAEAPVVREIFQRVANGDLIINIADDFNQRAIPTRRGGAWGKNSFQNILHNEKYIGLYKYQDIEIPGGMPQIIDEDLFRRVQEVCVTKKNPTNNKRRRTNNGMYLLTGKLFCGKCGAPMTGLSGTARNGDLKFYYVCQSKRRHHSCDKENVQRDYIEKVVAKTVREYIMNDDILEWIADLACEYSKASVQNSDLSLLYAEQSNIEKSINNILKAIEAGIFTETTAGRLKELEAEQKKIKGKIVDAKEEVVELSRDDILAGLIMFRDGDFEDQRFLIQLFDTFLKAVYIYDDNLKIVFSFSGDKNTVSIPLNADTMENASEVSSKGAVRFSSLQVHSNSLKRTAKLLFYNGEFMLVAPLIPAEELSLKER